MSKKIFSNEETIKLKNNKYVISVSEKGIIYSDEDKRVKREKHDIKLRDIILQALNHQGYKKGSRSIKMVLEYEFNQTKQRVIAPRSFHSDQGVHYTSPKFPKTYQKL